MPNNASSTGKITIRSKKYLGQEDGRRTWSVEVSINDGGGKPETVTVTDPWKEEIYERVDPRNGHSLSNNVGGPISLEL